jgi:Trypsin-co-occurring domain 1
VIASPVPQGCTLRAAIPTPLAVSGRTLALCAFAALPTKLVTYGLDDETGIQFEIDPPSGFQEAASADKIISRVRDAVEPAVDAARVVLERVREVSPDQVEVTFGIKVNGKADWIVARVASEGNFEIKLIWAPNKAAGGGEGAGRVEA